MNIEKLDPNKIIIDTPTIYMIDTPLSDVENFESEVENKSLGSSKGGFKLDIVPVIRQIEYDGSNGNATKGAERITGWTVTGSVSTLNLTDNMLESSLFELEKAGSNYDTYVPCIDIEDSHYKHLIIVGKMHKLNHPVIVEIANTYNEGGLSVQTNSNNEGSASLTFNGKFTGNEVPCKIHLPNK